MSAYRDAPLSVNEQSFVRSSLSVGLRLDGRAPADVRAVALAFPAGSGTAQVQLGGTRVLAVTTADLVVPFPDRPNEGTLSLFVNFSAMASPAFEPGHPSDRGVEQARLVERALRESRALDVESLCVLAGEKVWAVRLDAHVLDVDGNVQDALMLACVAALAHFRRPDVTVVGDNVTVHSVEDRQPVPLALHHLPIATSFAFFDPLLAGASGAAATVAAGSSLSQPALMVVDPSLKEEQCADSGLTVILNVHGEVCTLQKSGGMGVALESILAATQVAQHKVADLTAMLQERLKEEALVHTQAGHARRTGGVGSTSSAAASGTKGVAQVFHQPALPIDAFGSNVTKAPGEHVTAGKPIEIRVGGAADGSSDDSDDDEEGSEQEGGDSEDEDMQDTAGQAAEMAQAASKLQSKLPHPTQTQAQTKGKRK